MLVYTHGAVKKTTVVLLKNPSSNDDSGSWFQGQSIISANSKHPRYILWCYQILLVPSHHRDAC